MFLRSLKLFIAAALATVMAVGCGNGSTSSAPTGLAVKALESSVSVTWDMLPGVEYWLFYGPKDLAPTGTDTTKGWVGIVGGGALVKVTSPVILTNMLNEVEYAFTVNARTNGSPGGPGATPVYAKPRISGATWTVGTPVATAGNDLRAVTYGSAYVAGGQGGVLAYSADGSVWSPMASGTTQRLNGATYYAGYKFVGDAGTLLTSTDGVTWALQPTGSSANLYAIASNLVNLTVAVGANGTILTSADGITWTPASSPTTRDLVAVTYSLYNSGTWIAVGAGGTLLTSTNGITWVARNSNTTADLTGVAHGPLVTDATTAAITTTYAIVGSGGSLLSSPDAVNWTVRSGPTGQSTVAWNGLVYGTQYVAVGAGGNIATSIDGVTWVNSAATGTAQNLLAVARGGLGYAAVGAAGTVLLSK